MFCIKSHAVVIMLNLVDICVLELTTVLSTSNSGYSRWIERRKISVLKYLYLFINFDHRINFTISLSSHSYGFHINRNTKLFSSTICFRTFYFSQFNLFWNKPGYCLDTPTWQNMYLDLSVCKINFSLVLRLFSSSTTHGTTTRPY